MKTFAIRWFSITLLTFLSVAPVFSQDDEEAEEAIDSTGLPGDNFSLEAALELFKKAESPEDFEKMLNSENNDANNLDLNEDGKTDYVRVVDRMEGDVHAFVLQVPVSEKESQDVAVIELEKTGKEEAMLQIVGDEDVFGEETIVEPFDEETEKGGKNGPALQRAPLRVVVNVWGWPSVRFVYRPAYVAYVSPWRWAFYPTWWRPWRPVTFGVFVARPRPFAARCHVVTTHRAVRAHAVYKPLRTHSTVVRTKTTTVRHGRHGTTVKTKKTTTVHGKHGNTVRKTKTTKTKTNRRGRH